MKKLSVYYVNYNGRSERMVAANNQKVAAMLMNVTLSHLRNYGGETGNEENIQIALGSPGTVFEKKSSSVSDPWYSVEGGAVVVEPKKAPVKRKKSTVQIDTLCLMTQGWQLGVTQTFNGGCWLQKGGCGRGGESKTVSSSTKNSMWNKGLIDTDKHGFPLCTYKLTEMGRHMVEEYLKEKGS